MHIMWRSYFVDLLFQVPVVRKTGGLADTVFDMDDQSNQETANGWFIALCEF